MIMRDCCGFHEVPDPTPVVSIGPSGIGGEYQKEIPKIDKNTPEPILDEILGLADVCQRIIEAISKQREVLP